MPCYAMACHQRLPCKTIKRCQRVWHYCEPPDPHDDKHLWICRECGAVWRFEDDDWWRDPIRHTKRRLTEN